MKRVLWLSIFLFLYVTPTFAKPATTKDFPELLSSRQLLALTPARRMAYFIKVRQMMLELSAMSAKGKGSLVAIQDIDPSRWESLMNVLVPAAEAAQCNDPAYPFDLGSVCGVPCGGRDKYGHERSQAVGGVYFCFSESEYRSAGANPVLTLKQKLDTRGTWAEVKPRLEAATEQAAAKIRQRNDPLASIGSGRVGPDGRPIGESKAGADNGPAGTNVTANNRKTQQEQSTALTVGTPPLAPWEKTGEAGAVGGPSGVASTNPGKSCSRAGDVYSKFSDACVAEETYKDQMVAYNKEKDEAITADKIVATSTPESPACKASTVNCSDKDKYRKSERDKALEEFRKDAP